MDNERPPYKLAQTFVHWQCGTKLTHALHRIDLSSISENWYMKANEEKVANFDFLVGRLQLVLQCLLYISFQKLEEVKGMEGM